MKRRNENQMMIVEIVTMIRAAVDIAIASIEIRKKNRITAEAVLTEIEHCSFDQNEDRTDRERRSTVG